MTSILDPAAFEAARRKALEDQRVIVPEGEYLAVIDDLRFRRAGEPDRWIVDVLWDILDDKLRASLRSAKVIVPQPVPLDLDEVGLLADDPCLNIGIRRIREALGQDDVPAGSWSIRMLRGAGPARITVRTVECPNVHDTDGRRSEVRQVKRRGATDWAN